MTITGVNHITLAVTDLNRSLAFYTSCLGATLHASWARGAYLTLGDLWFCLSLNDAPVKPRTDDTHLALSCAPEDFAALSTKITQRADIWQENRSEGASLYFLDPDGHKLELHLGDLASRLHHYRQRPAKGVQVHT
ncbi:VOC family protein [Aliiroseovarius sp. 2305UL8-7]|uniref:VOC family protein n=1 Tax=Aliiroseovarius conchicola TaxID=3121637 RepID=UPI003526F11F